MLLLRLIAVAGYVAAVAALVALSQVTSSDALQSLSLAGFLIASAGFAYAFFRSSPWRCAGCAAANHGFARACTRCGVRRVDSRRRAREGERRAEEEEARHYASMAGEPVLVFAVDGAEAFRSVGDAAAAIEGIDVEAGELEALYTLDGRIVRAGARGDLAVLTVTDERDAADLLRRLRAYAEQAGLDSPADQPRAVADELLRRQWEARWPRRPRWLDRRLHGTGPDRL